MGIGSVKTGDTVRVTAVVSGATSTAKQVTDQTVVAGQRRDVAAHGPRPGRLDGSLGRGRHRGTPPIPDRQPQPAGLAAA